MKSNQLYSTEKWFALQFYPLLEWNNWIHHFPNDISAVRNADSFV